MEFHVTDQTLLIQLPERIDTAAASAVSQEIDTLCSAHPHNALVLDASHLAYISSSGLRVLLGLAKREKDFRVIEVSNEVFNVFSMTGFDRIIRLERRIREVSIDGCELIGKGGVGTVYRLTDDMIIKVFREGTPLAEAQREINLAREALVFGLPTAISFELVRVGGQYGIIHELIKAKTLANVIMEDSSKAEYYGEQLGRMMREIHQIHDSRHVLPSAQAETREKLNRIRRYFSDEQVAVLREIYDAIPQGDSVLHCDLHPKNIMVSNGELLLIDMGEVCYGNPLEDLSHTYSAMKGLVGDYQAIIGMDEQTAHRCFDSAFRAYFQTDDKALLAQKEEQIRVLSLVRNFSWLSLSDSFPQELVDACHRIYDERVAQHLPEIRTVLKTIK